jgi:hypothetical protein
MPFYDINRATVTNSGAGSETTHLAGKTIANQETVQLVGYFACARMGNAGGNILRLKENTGTVFSGGTAHVPAPKNRRAAPAAQSSWVDDVSAITAGTTLNTRGSVGFAATGGQGGYMPIVPAAAVQMMPNTTNPVDVEFTSIASQVSVNFDLTLDLAEGVSA